MTKMKKCQGVPGDSYPGLVLFSKIHTNGRACGLRPNEPVDHSITALNASTLTYEIECRSVCDKDYLQYVRDDADPEASNIWKSSFSAPWRWDRGPRRSEDSARIEAKTGMRAKLDREINVEVVCKSPQYDPIGPFRILLQVDHEGS